MSHSLRAYRPILLLAGFLLTAGVPGFAQTADEPPPQPAANDVEPDAPATRPIEARVIEINGDVKYAPIDSADWKLCSLDDRYPPETKILTGIRSSVKLQIGDEEPYTLIVVDSVGLTTLSEAYVTEDTKKVRIGVGYGRVTGGVAESGLRSDFTIDSPVATLSKRGTWGFSLFYERDTDAFEIKLADRGLVEALNRLTSQRRLVNPGEYVTEAMRAWMDEVKFRNVAVPDILGQEDIEVAFNRLETDGLGVVNPGSGRSVLINLSNASARNDFANLLGRSLLTPPPPVVLPPVVTPPGVILRPEGFFGTGRGDQLIPVLIDATSPLAQKGFAQPGRYVFRRSALEGWMRNAGTQRP